MSSVAHRTPAPALDDALAGGALADGELAGGASSPVRAGRRVGGDPFVCARAEGPYAYDAEGRRYVDYVMAYGPLLFGHTPPFLRDLDALAARGILYGSTA